MAAASRSFVGTVSLRSSSGGEVAVPGQLSVDAGSTFLAVDMEMDLAGRFELVRVK